MEGYSFAFQSNPDSVRVKLDANENWHISADELHALIREAVAEVDVRAYPLGKMQDLCVALAKHLSLPKEAIIPTQGADQGIDLLCQAFLKQQDGVIIVGPTYSFYRLRAALAGARCTEVALNEDLSLPVDEILRVGTDEGMIFLCSPNNPTGNQFQTKDVLRLVDASHGLVVVDEAYVDFAPHSLVDEVMNRRNLVVLRTFSKAFGLADLRLGFVIANPDWAPFFLDHVQYPYPLSGVTIAVALRLLQEFHLIKEGVESLKRERAWLRERLMKMPGVEASSSEANFILANLSMDASKAHAALLERGIATKMVGRVLCMPNCIRVTVGTREMNSVFLEALIGAFSDV